jgi:hypothetical protein
VEHLLAYVDSDRTEFCDALENESFLKIAYLEDQYRLGGRKAVDLAVYRRKPALNQPGSGRE